MGALAVERSMELVDTLHDVAPVVHMTDEAADRLSSLSRISALDTLFPATTLHLGTGCLRPLQVARLQQARIEHMFVVQDDFNPWVDEQGEAWLEAWMNYTVEAWRVMGVDPGRIRLVPFSEVRAAPGFGRVFARVLRRHSVGKALRTLRVEKGAMEWPMEGALRPALLAALLGHLRPDLCQMGMDEEDLWRFAVEVGSLTDEEVAPAAFHRLLPAVRTQDVVPQRMGRHLRRDHPPMSRADPAGAIWVHDDDRTILTQLRALAVETDFNPLGPLGDFARDLVLPQGPLRVEAKHGKEGDQVFEQEWEIGMAFRERMLHPRDFCTAVMRGVCEVVAPVRKHFESGRPLELLETVEEVLVS